MTACFKLMRALQPDNKHQTCSLCEPCVYYSRNLDPSYSSSNGPVPPSCGLDFSPGDDNCCELRTNNCSAGKR